MTKEIALTQGRIAIVDDADLECLSSFRWYAALHNGYWYAQTSIRNDDGKWITVRMHRMILGAPKSVLVDHVDGDGLNNTRPNLRLATRAENNRNCRKQKTSTNDYKGITFDGRVGRWQAHVNLNGKSISLGYFDTPEEAAKAYDAGARECYGEFARLNFPEELVSDPDLVKRISQFHAQRNNSSGYHGVSWDGESQKWRAMIQVRGEKHDLGRFELAPDAARAYDGALLKHGGNPRRLNFSEQTAELVDWMEDVEWMRRGM